MILSGGSIRTRCRDTITIGERHCIHCCYVYWVAWGSADLVSMGNVVVKQAA